MNSCKVLKLLTPPLEEIAEVLRAGLSKNFATVDVSVVDCPDLSQPPFSLAAPGLCGDQKVVEVGGPEYLFPFPNKEKLYRLNDVLNQAGTTKGLVLGPLGPWPFVGADKEMANVHIDGDKMKTNTQISKVNTELDESVFEADQFAYLANLYISKGERSGKVLEVKASKRTGEESYSCCIRNCLAEKYGDQPVGLGGTFLVEQGKAKLQTMLEVSGSPVTTWEQLNPLLKFDESEAPLTAVGYLVSHDPGLDLRVQHFHCFTDRGFAGHYHYDVTPDAVAYKGYFGLAKTLHRFDQPEEKN